MSDPQGLLFSLLCLVMRPVARFCLRRSLRVQDAIEAFKLELVAAAKDEMRAEGREMSVSRLSAMTGLHRRDAMRLCAENVSTKPQTGLIARIIGQWQHDPRFSRKGKAPRVLSVEGKESEFAQLVRCVSKDLNPYTVYFELERMKYIERSPKGVRLRVKAHLPRGNAKEGFAVLARDMNDLLLSVEENVMLASEPANLHLRTEYDNICLRHSEAIRRWLFKEGSAFHERARRFFSQLDKDTNPALENEPGGARVVLCAFGRVELETDPIAGKESSGAS